MDVPNFILLLAVEKFKNYTNTKTSPKTGRDLDKNIVLLKFKQDVLFCFVFKIFPIISVSTSGEIR
jgi:hypothetical protein